MSTELLRALGWDLVTGRPSGLPETIQKAIAALDAARVPYAVSGAVALGARGCVRTTLDVDVVVLADDVSDALTALAGAGLEGDTDVGAEVEPQYVLRDPGTGASVDLLVGFGEPEYSLVQGATRIEVAGVRAPVARPEHLLLSYLYSNQPRHQGDFASLVQQGRVSKGPVRELLADIHPEMLAELDRRWERAESPPPPPERPPPRQRP